jgi:DNA mismatch endonuclease (patch repair protein)
MADKLTRVRRSWNMSRIRAVDTKPEMYVRRLIYSMGYRYRIHVSALPGKPDLVFPRRRKVIFVHGCFWHQHPGRRCRDSRLPKTSLRYWRPKLKRNAVRDMQHIKSLKKRGWKVLTLWECEVAEPGIVQQRIEKFLGRASQ